MEVITVEQMMDIMRRHGVVSAIEWAQEHYGDCPFMPAKPQLQKNASSTDAMRYAGELRVWEDEHKEYLLQMDFYNKRRQAIEGVIEDFIKEAAGLSVVPKQYQDKVFIRAYKEGHSAGFYEVYLKIKDLIGLFDD